MIFVLAIFLAFLDIASVKSEPDPNRRSELALMNADEKLEGARQAYMAGNEAVEEKDIQEVTESVVLCYASLEESHQSPRKSKYYKRAELKVSALMRRMSGFRDDVSYNFRPHVDAALMKISDIHDEILSDIMSRKK